MTKPKKTRKKQKLFKQKESNHMHWFDEQVQNFLIKNLQTQSLKTVRNAGYRSSKEYRRVSASY